ncbi:RNA polymerase sigma factor [Frigoribacterium sp. PvP032]|uniref:RNA polymerase sigma factor n=1 Tax=Frigoribacterium sp. PvP032 TaxID=2806589 RepID=UPI001AE3EDA8|nr:sigma-70 family RNA polymerase sigma factor [Frigoribacterium sp. PvP032]MBP1189833.1 RNA polymerase sigma-70 factor (ECF subfamily) [Frigoribacterium sp. PvP032]
MSDQPRRVDLADADDHTLVERAGHGDVRAFEVLVRRYGPLMRSYARRVLGRSDDVDDVVQEAFVAAWKQLPSIEDPAKVKSWLMRIVSRRCVDRIRARRDHDDIADHDSEGPEHETPHRVVEARSREHALTLALEAMPDPQRRAWILKEMVGHSYDEIADDLRLPLSTVRGLLSRARKNMITEMEAWR